MVDSSFVSGVLLYVAIMVLGICAGGANAGSGVGWGLISVPALIGILRFSAREGVALSLLGSLGVSFSAGTYRLLKGGVDWKAAVLLVVGSFIGGLLGTRVLDLVPDYVMRRAIGLVTVLAGLFLLFGRSR